MLDIIGVGDTNVDVMIRVPHIASHDEKVRGQLLGNFPGGIIGNFCCAAAAFGAKAGAVCKVGMDGYGELAKSDLQRRGVDISHMVVDPACETYFCMVLLDDTGEKALTIVETSGFLPKPEEVDLAYLKTAKRVHMTSLDMTLAAHVAQALDGTQTLLSMDIEATAGTAPAAVWDSVLQRVDTAFPNEAGLAALTGCTNLEAGAQQLLARGVRTVVVTCGENGAWVFRKGYSTTARHFPSRCRTRPARATASTRSSSPDLWRAGPWSAAPSMPLQQLPSLLVRLARVQSSRPAQKRSSSF